jgi:hypothetical protein
MFCKRWTISVLAILFNISTPVILFTVFFRARGYTQLCK